MTNGWKIRWNSSQLAVLRPVLRKLLAYDEKLKEDLYVAQFDQRDDDIFIVTYMKSGTTLLQCLVYQMVTEGSMDFEHIYDVSPWFELSMGQNKSLKNFRSPRIIKSHSAYRYFPKRLQGKIVYGIRNVFDVAVSAYHHTRNYENPELEWEKFLNDFLTLPDHWFSHVSQWMKNENGLSVHYVYYEDLVMDKPKVINELAEFLEIKVSPEKCERVIERTSFSYMKAREEKFGVPRDKRVFNQFIRKGEVYYGNGQFKPDQIQRFEALQKRHLNGLNFRFNN